MVRFKGKQNFSCYDAFQNIALYPIAIIPEGALEYYQSQDALSNFTIYEESAVKKNLEEKTAESKKLIEENAGYYEWIPEEVNGNLDKLIAEADRLLSGGTDVIGMARCWIDMRDARDLAELYIMDLQEDGQLLLNSKLKKLYAVANKELNHNAVGEKPYREGKSVLLDATNLADLQSTLAIAKTELDNEKATQSTIDALQNYIAMMEDAAQHAAYADFARSEYVTLYSNLNLTVPENVEAAIVTPQGTNGLNLDFCYMAGSIIPAHTGVVLKGDRGDAYYLREGETTAEASADNLLHGTTEDALTQVDGTAKYYKLAYDLETGTKIGFYWGAQDGAAFTNKAGKAFLALPTVLPVARLAAIAFSDIAGNGSTTGIDTATATSEVPFKAYDLNGRLLKARSLNELPKGVYLVNGKKIMK